MVAFGSPLYLVTPATLQELGRLTYAETTTLTVLLIALGFWIGGSYVKPTPISTMAVAFMALSLLLLTGALNWDDCLACTFAWDTLFWIAILMVRCYCDCETLYPKGMCTTGLTVADFTGGGSHWWALARCTPSRCCFDGVLLLCVHNQTCSVLGTT